jgi:hypothetical protein
MRAAPENRLALHLDHRFNIDTDPRNLAFRADTYFDLAQWRFE